MIKKIFTIVIYFILIAFLIFIAYQRFFMSIKQDYNNNKNLKTKTPYTILCLGDSTTKGQYPIQLQQILNEKYPNKFSIIDQGIGGANLETILNLLDNNLKKFNPNIVICMMGGNDLNNFSFFIKHNVNPSLEKATNVIKNKLKNKINKNIDDLEQEAAKLFHQHEYDKAEKTLKDILDKEPNRELSFFFLFFIYKYGFSDTYHQDLTYKMAKKAIDNNFNIGKPDYYNTLIKNGNNKDYYINKAINDTDFPALYLSYRDIVSETNDPKIKQLLLDKIEITNPEFFNTIYALKYLEEKNYQKAQEYFDNAEKIRLDNSITETESYNLYKAVIKKLLDKNIKVICMQYPVISILPLQENLKNEPYYNNITLISNERNFKEMLMKKEYNEVFNDHIASGFGHCTDLGNTMIAENVVNALEKILDLKEKNN